MLDTKFETGDIALACYLKAKGITLLEIRPVDFWHSLFIFEQPPQTLLASWLSGFPEASVRDIISEYRHLVKESRIRQQGVQ